MIGTSSYTAKDLNPHTTAAAARPTYDPRAAIFPPSPEHSVFRMRRLAGPRLGAVILCALLSPNAAFAGVSVVNDGADGAPALIRIQSAIRKGDAAATETAIAHVSQTAINRINGVPFITVELDSPGGDVVEALEIGRILHQSFAMTTVRPGRECVSACVFILMAGAVHTPAEGASIGLHKPLLVSWRNMSSAEAHAKYDALMAYLHQYFLALGVDQTAFDTMMRTGSYDMRYFSSAELDRLRLRGEDPAWERLYDAKWATARGPMIAATESAAPADAPSAQAPKLPAVDPAWRTIVYMPGAYHEGVDYLAGVHLPDVHLNWDSMDDGWQGVGWEAVDIAWLLHRIAAAIADRFGSAAWLLALLALELLRAPRLPHAADPSGNDHWRLGSFDNLG
jgi:hypothetical protein